MALEALSNNGLFKFLIHDTNNTSPTPYGSNNDYGSSETSVLPETAALKPPEFCGGASDSSSSMVRRRHHRRCRPVGQETADALQNSGAQGRKKRRRRPKVCKNKEEAETQRMTHIAVERNRRKQMNAHLAVLRSLMPESYVQRGDQASIVGGAIDYVKELEHTLQSLEAQKLILLRGERTTNVPATATVAAAASKFLSAPFAQFFAYPQYTWSQIPNMYPSKSNAAAVADIEVTLIDTHANLRILSKKSLRQLSKMVAGFQTLHLNILHLNVTTLDPLVLYSISAKVEEGCQLTSADDIAGAVHHMLIIIEGEAILC